MNLLDVADQSSVPQDVRVSEGGSCTLECQASGTPLPQVIWTRNGKPIETNQHFTMESTSNGNHRLIIKNALREHAGTYTANVKYKVQTQFMNFNLIITGSLIFMGFSSSFLNDFSALFLCFFRT